MVQWQEGKHCLHTPGIICCYKNVLKAAMDVLPAGGMFWNRYNVAWALQGVSSWSFVLAICNYAYWFGARLESYSVAYRGGGGVQTPPPPLKFRRPSKIMPNSTQLWKLLKIAEFRMPTHQDIWKEGSKILKLPPVRNCFTLAMTNKLAVITNNL